MTTYMAFPRSKGTARGDKARQPRPGLPLKKTLDKDVVVGILRQEHGNVSRVADIIGTDRGTLRRYIDADPELIETLRQCRERQLDQLEQSCFDRAIETNDTTLQLFLLKTQGRS